MRGATAKGRGITPLIQGGTILAVILAWEIVGRSMPALSLFFPPFEEIARAGWRMLAAGEFNEHLATTGYELLWGFALGAGLGILVGIFLGSNRFFGGVLEPFVYYVAVVPKIIIFPIFVLFLGIGLWSKVAMGASSAFFPIAINTMVGIHEVNPILVRVARTLGAGTLHIYTKVYLPAIVGPIVAGLRVGMGVAVIGTLIAETKLAKSGLGLMAIEQYDELLMPEMYSVLVIIFAGAMALNWGMSIIYARVTRYRAGGGGSL
ncbi:MAG: ABC transporter permease [Dehalococcoidia bacterium]